MKSLKNFGISVGVSVVIFGIVALFMINFLTGAMLGVFEDNSDELDSLLTPSTGSGDETSSGESNNSGISGNIQGNSFTILMIGVNDISENCDEYFPNTDSISKVEEAEDTFGFLKKYSRYRSAGSIVLVRADKERGEYTFTPVSPAAMVGTDSGRQRIGDVYVTGGREFFVECIEALTGIRVDYYIAAKASDMEKIIEEIGAVNCNVPCDIYSCGYDFLSAAQKNAVEDVNNLIKAAVAKAENDEEKDKLREGLKECSLAIGKGSKTISKSASAVMMFADYSDGINDELAFAENFAKGLMSNFAKMSQESLVKALTNTGEYLDTNITSDFIAGNYGMISGYGSFEKKSVALPGSFVSAEDPFASYFNPDIEASIDAFLDYRKLPAETAVKK